MLTSSISVVTVDTEVRSISAERGPAVGTYGSKGK